MYFLNIINNLAQAKELMIFVDMDGVITDYEFGKKIDFKNKRPIMTNIKTLENVAKLKNVDLYILSICNKNNEINYKNNWLDKYAPYFPKDQRIIISKESNLIKKSKELKLEYLIEVEKNNLNKKQIIVIDDDNDILKYLAKNTKNIIFFQDSSLVD